MVSPPMDPSLSLWLSLPHTPPLTPSSSSSASWSGGPQRKVASSIQPLHGLLSVPNGANHAIWATLSSASSHLLVLHLCVRGKDARREPLSLVSNHSWNV